MELAKHYFYLSFIEALQEISFCIYQDKKFKIINNYHFQPVNVMLL